MKCRLDDDLDIESSYKDTTAVPLGCPLTTNTIIVQLKQ